MRKYVAILLAIISLPLTAQNPTKVNDTNDVHINWNGENIRISQKRIDSLTKQAMESFSRIINEVETQKYIAESIETLGAKLDHAIDILIEDNRQREKVKKELKTSIKSMKPALDSAIQSIKINIDTTKRQK